MKSDLARLVSELAVVGARVGEAEVGVVEHRY